MNQNLKDIKALVTLLGDDDPKIREIAKERLLAFDQQAAPFLTQVTSTDCEGRIRIEAHIILEELRLKSLADNFRKLNRDSNFDLETTCFILAQIEYPHLVVSEYRNKLDCLALEAEEKIFGIEEEKRRVEKINHFLFNEKKFRGNKRSYYDPQNSYINKVLDSHLGIPISLSAIYLFIAERLHLPVLGVGLPGHFLLKYNHGSDPLFIDAFNHGRILTPYDCELFVSKMGYPDFDCNLTVSGPRDILARMIRNLVLIYLQNKQPKKIDTLEQIFSDLVMH